MKKKKRQTGTKPDGKMDGPKLLREWIDANFSKGVDASGNPKPGSQSEAARYLDVTRQSIHKWVNGEPLSGPAASLVEAKTGIPKEKFPIKKY